MREKLSKYIAYAILFSGVIVLIGFVISCVPTVTAKPMPASKGVYTFSGFRVPTSSRPGSFPLTIAVVEPLYRERVMPEYSRVMKSFSNRIALGLEEIIVAKGMTSKGPYGNLDELPFPDKKASNLTLTQTVFLVPYEKGPISRGYDTYQGVGNCEVDTYQMSLEAWLTFEMREPLSAEKMWIKRLDMGILEQNYQIGRERYFQQSADPWAPGEWKTGKVVFNTKLDTYADILNQIYNKVMQSAWTYIHPEEMLILNEKSKEIRELKRY